MSKNKVIFRNMDVNEIIEIVDKLNWEIYDQYGSEENLYKPINFRCDGEDVLIEFFDYPIWDSDCDERKFDEDKDDWEPLEEYLRKEIRNIFNVMSKIKI